MGTRAGRAFVLHPTRYRYVRTSYPYNGETVGPEAIAAISAMPEFTTPNASIDAGVIAATTTVPATTIQYGQNIAATPVAAVAARPAEIVSVPMLLQPVRAYAAVPAVSIRVLFPETVSASSALPAPALDANSIDISPETIAVVATITAAGTQPIFASTIAATADVKFADNGNPPGPVTGFTATTSSDYAIELSWTAPDDVDFDHVVILRTQGLPYANPGDELLDPSIAVINTAGSDSNATIATAKVVTSGTFSDMQTTIGRPPNGPQNSEASWYVYTPDSDGMLSLDTLGSEFDTFITLLESDGTTVIAWDDDTGGSHGGYYRSSWMDPVAVTGGTTYYIVVQGYAENDAGDAYFNLVGPAPAPAAPVDPILAVVDTGLTPNTDYYYAIYSYDWAGNVNTTQVTASARTTSPRADAPLDFTITMPVGSFSILAGTPIEPVGSDPILYYGVPFDFTLTAPAGISWNVNLTEPPPKRPGEGATLPVIAFDPAIVRTPTDIRVELWDETNTTKIADLDYSAGRQLLDEYNGVGSGTLRVPAMHPDVNELTRERVLRFYYKDIEDPVFASILENRKTTVVGEAGDEWTEVSGRGLLAWLEDAVVLPFVPDKTKLPTGYKIMSDGTRVEVQSNIMAKAPDVRAFNFGSRDAFDHSMFDDLGPGSGGDDPALAATWVGTVGVKWSARTDDHKGNPVLWPDHDAYWLSIRNPQADAPEREKLWFRGSFYLAETTTVDLHMTGDDYCYWYMDGTYIERSVNWRGYNYPKAWTKRTLTLSAGIHYFQCELNNAFRPFAPINSSSIIAVIYPTTTTTTPIFRTHPSTWSVTTTPQTFMPVTEANLGPGWHRPLGIAQTAAAPLNAKQYFPTDWPDPAAKWIWGSDPTVSSPNDQVCWFRAKIWIPATGTYRWFSTADDSYVVWFDGIEIASLNYDTTAANGWMRTDEVDLELDEGWHVVSMRGQNKLAPFMTATSNPAAVIGTLMTLDANLKPLAPVPFAATSNAAPATNETAGWWANWAGPAWKAGDVLYTLVKEAKDRGVTRFQNLTMDFVPDTWDSTGTLVPGHDSDGNPWTTRVSRTWDVGTSLLQVAFDLCELGVDIWITPDNVLHCSERRGSSEPTFAITYGENISGYATDETFTGASVAYTRTRTGWFTLRNDISEEILGVREAGISLANTDSEDQAIGLSHRAIGAVVIANLVATAQAIVPVPGSIPYVDANISDIIYVLSPNGAQRMGRLLSISISENEAGATTWIPEIEIWKSPFGDGVDPMQPRDPVDPNNPYDSSTWIPAAEDWTRFIPEGAGADYPRAVTMPGSSYAAAPSPSPSGSTAPPRNSAEAARTPANAGNRATPPNAERVAISHSTPLTTAGYHLWVDTTGVV